LSTVQDAGRKGFLASGFSPSGAMDLPAARLANLLVGNSMDMATIEMTLQGMRLRFGCDGVAALTGADFGARRNGTPVPTYRAFAVCAGDELTCGAAKSGCRGYFAVAGGFDLTPALGSFSTNLKCGVGGFEGRKLKAGDVLPLRCPHTPVARQSQRVLPVPPHLDETPRTNIVLRAVPGPQADCFGQAGTETFFGSWYHVTPASDRMGIKLEGAKIASHSGSDIISDGIAAGSVQVPASGKPIVMMADRQTTGGYAKIATVISADLPLLAQARPGDAVRFVPVCVEDAQAIAREAAQALRRLEYQFLTI
jgi:biotin-dependent carboxylase-like uncharacterized protein